MPFIGSQFIYILVGPTGLQVITYGFEFTILEYIIAPIYFVTFIILAILMIRTKLTYIQGFRRNFLIGVTLIICECFYTILDLLFFTDNFIGQMDFYALSAACLIIAGTYFAIRGLLKLNDYLDSIIVTKEQRYNSKTLVISIAITAIFSVIFLLTRAINVLILLSIISFCGFYSAIYSFYMHQTFKDLKIYMMLYFGIGISFITSAVLFGAIVITNYMIYYQAIYTCAIVFMLFLILGYLNFKNRISKIKI